MNLFDLNISPLLPILALILVLFALVLVIVMQASVAKQNYKAAEHQKRLHNIAVGNTPQGLAHKQFIKRVSSDTENIVQQIEAMRNCQKWAKLKAEIQFEHARIFSR